MPPQKFGQHFLIDKNIAVKLVNSACITKNDEVIEIGPGKGILTDYILKVAKKLVAVEIDSSLCENLKKTFGFEKRLIIINRDFLKTEPQELKKHLKKMPVFISNLPFYCATPILEKMFRQWQWKSAIFTFQKEVGERILAGCGSKKYGYLSLLVWFYSVPQKLFYINRNCFMPSPKIDSIVIKFNPRPMYFGPKITGIFFKIVTGAFSKRRKTVLNSLCSTLKLQKEFTKEKLLKIGIDPNTRAEDITPEKFLSLSLDFSKFI